MAASTAAMISLTGTPRSLGDLAKRQRMAGGRRQSRRGVDGARIEMPAMGHVADRHPFGDGLVVVGRPIGDAIGEAAGKEQREQREEDERRDEKGMTAEG